MANNISDIYKQNQVATATPKELVVLLYEGCIKNLTLAERALEVNRLDLANNNIIKAQNIISELSNTLDMSVGDISEHLASLYEFFLNELYQANISKDKEKINYVRSKMEELLETWQTI